MKRALITGIGGQDGSYLTEFLLAKGYHVYGLVRRTSTGSLRNIAHLLDQPVTILRGDMTDAGSLRRAVDRSNPHEIYNLAAQSDVAESFHSPESTMDINVLGLIRLLDAVRASRIHGMARIYQASSSEMFGNSPGPRQDEMTPFVPCSPYAVSKVAAHHIARNCRMEGMFVVCGILFNHESPRRGEQFVTRKISKGVAAIAAGKAKHVTLGNIDARRDWGFAGDYVRAMWMMLQRECPDDFVIGTGVSHSVRDFFDAAFFYAGLKGNHDRFIQIDESLKRPAELHNLEADPRLAADQLDWRPSITFDHLVQMMVRSDMEAIR